MGVTNRYGYTLTDKRKGRYKDMTYFMVDYRGNLKEISRTGYLRRMGKDNTPFVAYEDDYYLLITDCANDLEVVKNAILKMLQPNIRFDID